MLDRAVRCTQGRGVLEPVPATWGLRAPCWSLGVSESLVVSVDFLK